MSDFKSFVFQKRQSIKPPIQAKCVVHFRPKKDWKGIGYGFDWMRLGDTNVFGDRQPYKNIVSKQYENASSNVLVTDINKYDGYFRMNIDLYISLKTKYNPLTIPWKTVSSVNSKLGEYYCSWLSLFPAIPTGYANTEADLRLYLDIAESPDYLEFEDNEHFEITPKKITDDLGVGQRFWKSGNTTVKIKCKTEFNENQTIDIYAYKKDKHTDKIEKKLAGRLWVWENASWRRKTVNVLMVQVTTPPISGAPIYPNFENEKTNLNKCLSQALIQMKNEKVIDLDLSGDSDFKKRFVNGTETSIDSSKGSGLFGTSLTEYLEEKLKKQLKDDWKKYAETIKLYYFGESGKDEKDSLGGYQIEKTEGIFGFFKEPGGIVIFKKPEPTFASHELLHRLGLSHSFSNEECNTRTPRYQAKFTYKAKATENLMDYSHLDGSDIYSLWQWQWEIANNNV